MPLTHGYRNTGLTNQLFGRFIHANHRPHWIIRSPINIQNLFHGCYKLSVFFGRNNPTYYFPRLKFVFFSVRRTVSYEISSVYRSSTNLSANNRNDQRANPFGGSPQANAIRWASMSPSTSFSYTREVGAIFNASSRPSSTNRFLTRSIVRIPIFNTLLISSFICLSVAWGPRSTFSRISA